MLALRSGDQAPLPTAGETVATGPWQSKRSGAAPGNAAIRPRDRAHCTLDIGNALLYAYPAMVTFTCSWDRSRPGSDGEPLDLGGQRQRAVLARLLVAGGRAVPVSTLIDELWPGEPAGPGAVDHPGVRLPAAPRARTRPRAARGGRRAGLGLPRVRPARAAEQVDSWQFEQPGQDRRGPGREVWAAMERRSRCGAGPRSPSSPSCTGPRPRRPGWTELRLLAVERRADAAPGAGPGRPRWWPTWRRTRRASAAGGGLAAAGPRALPDRPAGRRARRAAPGPRPRWRDELGLDLRPRAAPPGERHAGPAGTWSRPIPPPAAEPPARPSRPGEPDAARPALRVLVADDQALVRAGLQVVLSAEPGLEPAGEVANGEQAIAAVRYRPARRGAARHPDAATWTAWPRRAGSWPTRTRRK